jgi:phosphatidate phosphatase APP1
VTDANVPTLFCFVVLSALVDVLSVRIFIVIGCFRLPVVHDSTTVRVHRCGDEIPARGPESRVLQNCIAIIPDIPDMIISTHVGCLKRGQRD